MPMSRSKVTAIWIAAVGAALVLVSTALDYIAGGYPGLGSFQIGVILVGFGLILAGNGLVRGERSGGFGPADVPWLLGVLSSLAVAGVLLFGSRAPAPSGPSDDPSIHDRLLTLEQTTRVPRRTVARCLPPSEGPVEPLTLSQVVSGLRKPVYVTTADDDTRRLFIVEKPGTIRIAVGDRLVDPPFLDIRDRVLSDDLPGGNWEQGLLSVAFPPDHASSGRFYVFYTARPDGLLTISRFRLSEDANRADSSSEEAILTLSTVGPMHNGGQLQFGPDGHLYVGVGDGSGYMWSDGDETVYGDRIVEYDGDSPVIPEGSSLTEADIVTRDPWNQGQDLSTLRGAILRIDVSGDSTYSVPSNNPFAADGDESTRGEIWAYGFRNPWRFSFDACDGTLFAGDVGRSRYEEIDLVEKGGNYGWRTMEGASCSPHWQPCDTRGLEFPITDYLHLELDPKGGKAVVGGYVYRGDRIPSLVGRYVFADFMSSRLWTLTPTPLAASGWQRDEVMTLGVLPSSFGLDAEGELLVVDYGGTIYRISPAS